MTFDPLGLSAPLLKAIAEKGYSTPSPIQAKAIPPVLEGRDVLAAAQTGTGKTAAFTLPVLQRLSAKSVSARREIRALVLTPTRELAAQVEQSFIDYGKFLDLQSTVVFGGVGIGPQIKRLQRGVDVLVATPGRLLDLISQGCCSLRFLEVLVLDEADRMLDMGFVNDMRKLLKCLPKKRQTLLFSATFSREIREISREFLDNPTMVEVTPENTTAETVAQRAFRCDAGMKSDLLIQLIEEGKWEQVLVFTRTKHGANRLSQRLARAGITSAAIHGDKSQGSRTQSLEGFKNHKVRVLVATDIAARGIDIAQLPHVVNFELPNVPEDYVHRIGRTGRAGRAGEAVSLVANDERPFFSAIERLISLRIRLEDVPGFVPTLWPDRAPSASEVQKAAEQRKREQRQQRNQGSAEQPRRSSGGEQPKRTSSRPPSNSRNSSRRDGRRPR